MLLKCEIAKLSNHQKVFEKGRRFKKPSCQFIFLTEFKETKSFCLHLSVLAIKKIVGKKAVLRNLAKRRLKAAVRASLQECFQSLPCLNVSLIIMASPKTTSLPWEQICSDVQNALHEISKEMKPHDPLS